MTRPRYITPEGFRRLAEEHREIWTLQRPRIVAEVEAAAALGDRSENAEYIYGKRKLRELDRRLRFLSERMDALSVVEPAPDRTGRAFFGAWVTVEQEDGEARTWRLVGADEIDLARGLLSVDSPMGRALLGRSEGDEVTVQRPAGPARVTIVAIAWEAPLTARIADRAAQRALVERFVAARPFALGWDAASELLLDVAAQKTLRLDWTRVAWLEERADADSGRPYLAVALGDGASLALADQGLAFAPLTGSTGPLPGLPRAVCFRDLQAAEARLTHFLLDHPDDRPERGHLETFFFCLAVVDGARAVGFEVGPEERRLERLLNELEARRRG